MKSTSFNNNHVALTPFNIFTPEISGTEQQQINQTYDIYANHLQKCESALEYLQNTRGLNDDIINRFQLGYADKSVCKQFRVVDNPYALRGMMQRAGVIGPKGHHIFLGSVIIPIKQNGIVVGGVGRRTSRTVRMTSTPYPFHLIDEKALFNADCLNEQPSCVVLCKSPIEALSVLGQGVEEVISLVGDVDFSDDHAKLLKS
jgi:DNA primase